MAEKIVGINSIAEALAGKRKIHRITYDETRGGKRITELLEKAARQGIYCQPAERRKLDNMYRRGNHQGIIAEIDDYEYAEVFDLLRQAHTSGEAPFLLMLDGIEDPQNLGAIIRTAEAAGVHGIILPRHNAAGINDTVIRAAAGATEHMLIATVTNLVNTIRELKEQGLWVVGADMQGKENYFTAVIPEPVLLIIGGEGRGIRRLVKEHCDLLLRIPLRGKVESLNASVAAALMMYEVVRRRQNSQHN